MASPQTPPPGADPIGRVVPLALASAVTELARDLAAAVDRFCGTFGSSRDGRRALVLVSVVAGYGAYRCLAGGAA
jgi:hypothetical protein